MEINLREYQQQIVDKVLSSEKNQIVCLPTGAGKTVLASAIINGIENPVCFIVPRLELIEQAKDTFGDYDVIWSNRTKLTGNHCIIASKDSLRTQYNKLPENVVLIIDEVHYSLEQSYKLVEKIKPKRVIGLTATPERMDGQSLIKGDIHDGIHKYGIFDELIQEETVPSLIKKSFLSPLHYYAKPIEGITNIKPDSRISEELSEEQMRQIFNEHNIWGDLVTSYEEYGKGRPALGFTNTIAMAEQVCQIFNNAGYDFRVIHGSMNMNERSELISLLEHHEIDGLVNAALLTYGFDCPPVSYAFSCRHIKSRPLWFQIVGRILRICNGKEDAVFIDHGDSISEFAEPECPLPILDEAISWNVNGQNKQQKDIHKKKMQKCQEDINLLQELDPVPLDLVEVTMESTTDRLFKLVRRLKNENDSLMEQRQRLLHKNEVLTNDLNTVYNEKKAAKNEIKDLRARITVLESKASKNSKNKPSEAIKEVQDPTFEFIRKNYSTIRTHFHNVEKDKQKELALTRNYLKNCLKNQPFDVDQIQFERSISWWERKWLPKEQYKR